MGNYNILIARLAVGFFSKKNKKDLDKGWFCGYTRICYAFLFSKSLDLHAFGSSFELSGWMGDCRLLRNGTIMDESNAPASSTKASIVARSIAESIKEQELAPGETLRSVRSLASQFDVSLSVIQTALRRLERDGAITRGERGFVVSGGAKSARAHGRILLCTPYEGHMYGDFYSFLGHGLLALKSYPILLGSPNPQKKAEWDRKLKEMVLKGVQSIIASGAWYWTHPFLEPYPEVKSVFLFSQDFPDPAPERAVWFDLEAATHLAATHLIQMGRRRILMITSDIESWAADAEIAYRTPCLQMRSGYERALREHDLAEYCRFLPGRLDDEAGRAALNAYLSGPEAPDAVLCRADHIAVNVEMAALRLGLRVPDDLAITGLYDTPWCGQAPVSISSVGFDLQRMADWAAELATADRPDTPIRYVRPYLAARASTGAAEAVIANTFEPTGLDAVGID